MKSADVSFQFVTASYLTRISNLKATNLAELTESLEKATDASIFHHTFQTLGRHHFLTEGFSNDFAQWALAACNQAGLAEQLASIDVRDYVSLADLRRDIHQIVNGFTGVNPQIAKQQAFEPFFFCDAIEVAVPLGLEVRSLEDFRHGLDHLSHASFHYHFVASRLRLHLRTNDFSTWLDKSLGLTTLAQRVNQIDIYTNTVESARASMIALVEKELSR